VVPPLPWPPVAAPPVPATQPPPTQVPAPQLLPQAPQCSGSVATFTQRPPQSCCGATHAHAELTQVRPAPQATSQVPQCAALEVVSTQSLPHWVSPLAQPDWQDPSEQTVPVAQARSQDPQWVALDRVSTQTPPQLEKPAWQAQAPATQDEPAPQTTPQAPQLVASVLPSTQPSAQDSSPAAQPPLPAPPTPTSGTIARSSVVAQPATAPRPTANTREESLTDAVRFEEGESIINLPTFRARLRQAANPPRFPVVPKTIAASTRGT